MVELSRRNKIYVVSARAETHLPNWRLPIAREMDSRFCGNDNVYGTDGNDIHG